MTETNAPVQKSDQSLSPSYSSWHDLNSLRIRGAMGTKGTWDDYYQMYVAHPMVRAAIDTVSRTATNTGWYYKTRDAQREPNEAELKILNEFFDSQPNLMSQLRKAYKHMMICGNAYIYIVTDRRRKPVRLKTLHPKTMTVRLNKHGEVVDYVQTVWQGVTQREKKEVIFKPNEVIHVKMEDPDSDAYGLSPLESLRHSVATDLFAQQYNRLFFQNSGVTGTIIAIKNANAEETKRNRAYLEENYTGPQSAHRPIVIEGENIQLLRSVANHHEMGFLEGRRFSREEILAVLDVPPAKVGIMETANRSNAKEQDKAFRENISNLQSLFEDAVNETLIMNVLKLKDMQFAHNPSDQQDAIELMEYFTKGEAWGVFNPNEVRTRLGYPEVEGGDINFLSTPTGAVPLALLPEMFRFPSPNTIVDPQLYPDRVNPDPPKGNNADNVGRSTAKALDLALTRKTQVFAAYSAALDLEDREIIRLVKKAIDSMTDEAAYRGYLLRARSQVNDESEF